MPYQQCMYAPPDTTGMAQETREGENARIVCQDEQGVIWHLSEDSEVGDWLRYEGEVLAYSEAEYAAWTAPPDELTTQPAKAKTTKAKTTKAKKGK